MQELQLVGLFWATVAGVTWSIVKARGHAVGKVGVVLALVPAAGIYLAMSYC